MATTKKTVKRAKRVDRRMAYLPNELQVRASKHVDVATRVVKAMAKIVHDMGRYLVLLTLDSFQLSRPFSLCPGPPVEQPPS